MTIEKIEMPQLGESVTEGTISRWLVSPGDVVKKYEPLAEVTTDKVNAEIPSLFSGVVKELIATEGEALSVGEVILLIDTEESGNQDRRAGGSVAVREEKAAVESNPQIENQAARYSPAVLRLSQEHRIDLSAVKGTGMGGRITRKDLLKLIQSGAAPQDSQEKDPARQNEQTQAEKPIKHSSAQPSVQQQSGDIEVPVNGIRKAIATNMVRSKHEIPHAWMMTEVDVTNLVQYRDSIKDEFKQKEGFPLTYFAFFVKAVAQTLKEFPQMNAMWAGEKIILKKEINISIAVASEDALFVPVIKHADEKSIKGIAREIADLAVKARSGKLQPDDVQGGTFTVNNTGSFGSIQSMGIINHPQAALLQVETIVKRPVIMNGMIAIRDMVNLCVSLDHRVLDGLICGRFMNRVKEILESTSKEHTPIY